MFFLFVSLVLAADPVVVASTPIFTSKLPPSSEASGTAVSSRLTVVNVEGGQVVSWMGSQSPRYDRVDVVDEDGGQIYIGYRGQKKFISVAVYQFSKEVAFITASGLETYVGWKGTDVLVRQLVAEMRTTDGRASYIVTDSSGPRAGKPDIIVGPVIEHGRMLPSHVAFVEPGKPILFLADEAGIVVWWDPSL